MFKCSFSSLDFREASFSVSHAHTQRSLYDVLISLPLRSSTLHTERSAFVSCFVIVLMACRVYSCHLACEMQRAKLAGIEEDSVAAACGRMHAGITPVCQRPNPALLLQDPSLFPYSAQTKSTSIPSFVQTNTPDMIRFDLLPSLPL